MSFLQSQPSNPWTRQPIFRIPGVVAGLILLLVLAHVARVAVSETLSDHIINLFAFIPARYSHAFLVAHNIDPGNLFDRAIPFVSYMALHNDFTHLAVNSLWLLAFGPIVARRYGALLFLGFFLICGIAAAATHLAFNWGSLTPVIGASGAISGLMGAGMRLLPTQAPWAAQGNDELAPIFSRQIVIFTAIWLVVNLAAGLTGFGLGPGELGQIAWQAHVGGYLAGLLLAGPFDRLRPRMAV